MALTLPIEQIQSEARTRDPRAALLALARLLGVLVVGIPYILGWSLRKIWLGLTMLWTAAAIGWREAGDET